MHKSGMRQLLPLAVVCLLAAQLAAGTRIGASRSLLRAVKPNPQPVNLTRNLFVQATWALEGVSCDDVTAQTGNKYVNNSLAIAATADTLAQAAKLGQSSAVVVAQRQPCVTFEIGGKTYASYRTMVRINTTTTTAVRDDMWWGVYAGSTNGCKTGGYDKTLWANVANLFKNFTVSQNNGNRNNSFGGSPGGPGPTGTGMNWIDYAAPNMTVCQPKPSPSPSPSPEVPSPSPSPSPSPVPVLCPNNSAPDASGACVCNSGFTSAFNGTTVIACLNSTSLTGCPPEAPVAVKPKEDPTPTILYCITQDTPCPANYTLALYSGNPSVRVQCRPSNGNGCSYTGFGIKVTKADETLIGCVNGTSGACPFVAFRGGAPSYAVEKCVDVTACPLQTSTNSAYTVSAFAPGSAVPVACLTLGATDACPDITGLSFPLEVVAALPTNPVCGATGNTCNPTSVVQCLTANATCPTNFGLRLYSAVGIASGVPVVIQCRPPRQACDLTATGMGNIPNAATYSVSVKTGDFLEGCMLAGTSSCPAGFPFPSFNGNQLDTCRPTVPALTCATGQLPLMNVNGTTVACLTGSACSNSSFPVTLRAGQAGTPVGCMALTSSCPNSNPFPLYGTFNPAINPSGALLITNCWAAGIISNCGTVYINVDVPPGVLGFYPIPVLSSTSGLLGCIENTPAPTSCPASAPFAIFNGAMQVVQCSPVGEVTSCGADFVPAKTKSILTGCIPRSYFNANPLVCPDPYPVTQLNVTSPAPPGGLTASSITGCLTSTSDCSQHATGSPFTLINTLAATQLTYCVVTPNGLTGTCSNYPDGVFTKIPLFDPTGANQVGCTDSDAACPTSFPVFFRSAVPAIDRCQASIVGQCPANYPTASIINGTIAGCQASSNSCPAGQIPQSATFNGPIDSCVPSGSCNSPYPVALYDGSNGNGQQPVRCLSASAANCDLGSTFGMFNVEVYNGATLVGCMKSNVDTTCPAGAYSPLMFQVGTGAATSFEIAECRAGAVTCGSTLVVGGKTYSIPLKNNVGTITLGCLAAGATTCPQATVAAGIKSTSPYGFAFFAVSGAGAVQQCWSPSPLPPAATTCDQFVGASFPIEILVIGDSTTLAGCASSALTSCPAGYLPAYTGATFSTCVASASCPVGSLTLYNQDGTKFGCGDTNSCIVGTSPLGSTLVEISATGAPPVTGCMAAGGSVCPAGSFAVFEAASLTAVQLVRCYTTAPPNCAGEATANIPIYSDFTATTLTGCTLPGAYHCPTSAPYFFADEATGQLLVASNSFCSVAAPISGCGATRLPVKNIVTAGTAGGIIGCLDVPQIVAGGSCPATVPAAGTYTFPVVYGVTTGGVTVGNIGECIKGSSCGALVPFRTSTSTPVLGCVAGVNAGFCPNAAGSFLGTDFQIALYDKTSSTDATAKTVACIDGTITACSSVAGYPVPVGDDLLSDPTVLTLRGCMAANTACPVSGSATDDRYPLIDSAKTITSCRAASACGTNGVPLCDVRTTGTVADTFACTAAADTRGCLAVTATTPYTICSQLSSTGALQRYPSAVAVASQYRFSAKWTGSFYEVFGCGIYATGATICAYPVGGSVKNAAYPPGAAVGSTSFQGCTDGAFDAQCTPWWRQATSQSTAFCAAT